MGILYMGGVHYLIYLGRGPGDPGTLRIPRSTDPRSIKADLPLHIPTACRYGHALIPSCCMLFTLFCAWQTETNANAKR